MNKEHRIQTIEIYCPASDTTILVEYSNRNFYFDEDNACLEFTCPLCHEFHYLNMLDGKEIHTYCSDSCE